MDAGSSHLPSVSGTAPRGRPDAATAAVRVGVRRALTGVEDGAVVLVGVSGGADSMALAAATLFEARSRGIRVCTLTVDHGLQQGSDRVAERTRGLLEEMGARARTATVSVSGVGGPEAAARDARYEALAQEAARIGADLVLLGHTLDDQAETVLLGLARGSGTGSLKGMPERSGLYARPLLEVRRAQTRRSCRERRIPVWDDPQNDDDAYTRVRVRERVLPALERELGPGIAEALARTACQAREDDDAFERMIAESIEEICAPAEAGISVETEALRINPAALRNRIIRHVARAEFGVSLTRTHTLAIASLVTAWHGQGPIDVPGIRVSRSRGRLLFQAR